MTNNEGHFLERLKKFFVPGPEKIKSVTNEDILNELTACFDDSCQNESVGNSLLFYMHFIVILHPDVYKSRSSSFEVIVVESINFFYRRLSSLRTGSKKISPISEHWRFRFGMGTEFNQEKVEPNDIRVIGMLTGLKEKNSVQEESFENAKLTMRSKTTNVFEKMDINPELQRMINIIRDGTYERKFDNSLQLEERTIQSPVNTINGFAKIEYYLADKNLKGTYIMKDKEIVIARKEPENSGYNNYLLIESEYVSNPHARIHFNDTSRTFQIASFGRNDTRVNEKLISKSEPGNPQWEELNENAQILLSSVVTLKFKSSQTV